MLQFYKRSVEIYTFSCPITSCAIFSNSKQGTEVHVWLAHVTSTEKSSKNVTNELVRKSGRIFRKMIGKRRRLYVSYNFTANNNHYDESQVNCRLFQTQHEIEKFWKVRLQPVLTMQVNENQVAIRSYVIGFYVYLNLPVSMKWTEY